MEQTLDSPKWSLLNKSSSLKLAGCAERCKWLQIPTVGFRVPEGQPSAVSRTDLCGTIGLHVTHSKALGVMHKNNDMSLHPL